MDIHFSTLDRMQFGFSVGGTDRNTVHGTGVTNIVFCTKSDYDALETPSETTLYLAQRTDSGFSLFLGSKPLVVPIVKLSEEDYEEIVTPDVDLLYVISEEGTGNAASD